MSKINFNVVKVMHNSLHKSVSIALTLQFIRGLVNLPLKVFTRFMGSTASLSGK